MQQRPLGRSGLNIVPLVFGGNVFSWTVDEARAFELLDAFVDAGCNLIDTADVYSYWAPGNRGGESETIIGRWLQRSGKRNRVLIATKVGKSMGPGLKGLAPDYIARAVEASLARLQTDHIDLYQAHADDPDTPLADTLGAFSRLIEQGKVRAIGASNYSAARIEEALAVSARHHLPRYETLQPEYNLYARAPFERDYAPLAQREQLGVISFYALANGFLSGKYKSAADFAGHARAGSLAAYDTPRGWRIVEALHAVAATQRATPAQVALAWQLTRPGLTAPIASATSVAQLTEIVGALHLALSAADLRLLEEASREPV
ncbi:Predicted oxidoreductase [Solimonas aquatica]|uniref:Predicted oxidoreductase n=1 Tax=Solimonas aquatica TaxID=489703 RepID=A0A1H9FTI0_9GAMM|nr:aldo/keto reductase [Solimonas aquatica]SEQ41069.1 Predicted oxidoreductase [Solimonas aquatica]